MKNLTAVEQTLEGRHSQTKNGAFCIVHMWNGFVTGLTAVVFCVASCLKQLSCRPGQMQVLVFKFYTILGDDIDVMSREGWLVAHSIMRGSGVLSIGKGPGWLIY